MLTPIRVLCQLGAGGRREGHSEAKATVAGSNCNDGTPGVYRVETINWDKLDNCF